MSILWGKPGQGILDRWSFVHLAVWFAVGGNLGAQHVSLVSCLAIFVVGAYLWEVVETTLEKYTNLVAVHEGPLNRWVSDPAMALIGGFAGVWFLG
jgi:hypothetical protein